MAEDDQRRPQFTLEERVFMVVTYCQTGSQVETLNRFRVQFPNSRLPSRHTVNKNYRKYIEYGTSTNRNSGNSGRRRTVRTPANIELVRQALQENPNMSARRNTCPHLNHMGFNRITRLELAMHPYHLSF